MVRRHLPSFVGLTVALGLTSCGGSDPPPQLATSGAQDRAASRVELVDLVVDDPVRAAKVRSLYEAIERLMLDTKKAEARELMALGRGDCPRSEAETHAAMQRFAAAELGALRQHARLQVELRRSLTPDEFERLDAIK